MTEEDYRLIDEYLRGEMSEKDRTAFSYRLETEEALRESVELQRELMSFVQSDEQAMREVLAKADHEHYEARPEGVTLQKWWILLPVLVVIGFVIWWAVNPAETIKVTEPSAAEIPSVTGERQDSDSLNSSPVSENPDEVKPEEVPDQEETPPSPGPAQQDIPEVTGEEVIPDPPVFAALDPSDFVTNPMLDDLIGGELRSGPEDSTSVVLFPVRDTLLLAEMMTAELRGFSTVAPPYEVLIFDNQEQSFLEDKPVIRKTLQGEAQEKGNLFQLGLGEVVHPGRYYVLVLDKDGEVLFGDAFLVR